MRVHVLVSAAALLFSLNPPSASAACTGKAGAPGAYVLSIESGGQTRSYRLNVPSGYRSDTPMPLVLNFHGLSDNAANFEKSSGMKTKGDQEGFITLFPDGWGNSWNAGWCCAPASTANIDDVQLARDLVAATSRDYCVDEKRVFASGFSNGAFMSHRLACEASDMVAAVAPASGEIAVRGCEPTRPVPVIQTHGRQDLVVPYRFGYGTWERWGEMNGCSPETTTYYQKGIATCVRFNDCLAGADAELCTVSPMGHDWPRYSTTDGAIDAPDFFWGFLSRHAMP